MKTIEITTYEITELSDKAQEKAFYKWLERHDYFSASENEASLKKFAESFPAKINNWSYGGQGSFISWSFTGDDDVEELHGQRLATYLWNNFRSDIYKGKYRESFRRTKRIFHPMVSQKECTDRQTKETYYWTVVCSRMFTETYNCPLTGYYIDNSLMRHIWEFMEKPDNRNFYDLMNDCLNEWVSDCEKDYEYCTSMEYFIEECQANEWMFDEHGRMI